MNLYLISQDTVSGYDTYDSAVVCASSSAKARNIHPNGGILSLQNYYMDDWAKDKEFVTAKLIGKASKNQKEGVICASFNAG